MTFFFLELLARMAERASKDRTMMRTLVMSDSCVSDSPDQPWTQLTNEERHSMLSAQQREKKGGEKCKIQMGRGEEEEKETFPPLFLFLSVLPNK